MTILRHRRLSVTTSASSGVSFTHELALVVTRHAVLVAAVVVLLSGCERTSDLRTTKMPIGTAAFTLEIADNDAAREHGLMQRDGMPDDHGMIFVFPDETQRAFWMKNTRFPLDILYVDGRGGVVSVKTMQPYDLTGITSDGAAKYAIELNAKVAERVKVRAGDRLTIPENARETKQ